MKRILPIVEGDGDTTAVPALVRRIAEARGIYDLQLLPAHKRGELPAVRRHFDAYLGAALKHEAPILWVMDYDCDQCHAVKDDLADLLQRARNTYKRQPVEFALMVKEFESLFLCDHESTCQVFPDIPAKTAWPADAEVVRGAKEWISKARPKGLAYKETVHQVKLVHQLDLDRLRQRSSSFQRFEQAVLRLLDLPEAT